MPHTLRQNYHTSFETELTASTTQSQGNGSVTADVNAIGTVANANDTITLQPAKEGLEVTIINSGANTLQIFPASGDNLGSGTNNSTTLVASKLIKFFCLADGIWFNEGTSVPGGTAAPSAYGSMFEDSSGSAHNTTTKAWITAAVGKVDGNSIITFANNALGDRLVVGAGGAGDYHVAFHCSSTNQGGNTTIAAINVNAVEQVSIKSHHAGDSSQERLLAASGYLTLAANDYITLELTSSTSSDVVSVHTCSVTIRRLS